MAVISNKNKDDEQTSGMNNTLGGQPQGQTQTQGQQPDSSDQQLSGPSAISSQPTPGLSTPPTPGQSANPKAGSGAFTNLRQYIKANEGNRVASTAAQQLQRTGQQAQKNITTGTAEFNKRAEAGSLQNRDTAVQDVKNIAQQTRQIDVSNKPVIQPPAPVAAAPQAQAPAPAPKTSMPAVKPPTFKIPTMKEVAAASQAQQAKTKASEEAKNAPRTAEDMYGNLLEGIDTKRFQDVINAEYKGPQSLRQAGMLDPISKRVDQAQRQLDQSGTAQGREEMLRDIYGKNRQYTQGQNKLDALLLNTDKAGVQNVVDQKQNVGNLKNQMMQAQLGSAALAQNLTNEIAKIQESARAGFISEQDAERLSTDARIKNAKQQGNQYYDMMSKVIAPGANKQVDMSELERRQLGIYGGEQMFNVKNLPKTELEARQLISKNEQARQEALSRLAGLDQSQRLDDSLMYADASKAGQQKVTDSVNTEQLRKDLNMSKEQFDKWAQDADIVGKGTGSGRYNQGGFKGRKSVYASAENKQNIGDLLKEAGYDFNAEELDALSTDPAIYEALGLPMPQTQSAPQSGAIAGQELGKGVSQVGGQTGLMDLARGYGTMQGVQQLGGLLANTVAPSLYGAAGVGVTAPAAIPYAAGSAAGSAGSTMSAGPVAAAIALATDADLRDAVPGLNSMVQEGALELASGGLYDKNSDLGKFVNWGQDIQGNALEGVLSSADAAGGIVNDLTGGNVGSSLFGGGKAAAKRTAEKEAQVKAARDAQKQILESLASKGFDRRAGVVDTKAESSKLSDIDKEVKGTAANIANVNADQKKYNDLIKSTGINMLQDTMSGRQMSGPNIIDAGKNIPQLEAAQAQVTNVQDQIKKTQDAINSGTLSSKGLANYKRNLANYEKQVKDLNSLIPMIQKYTVDGREGMFNVYSKNQQDILNKKQEQLKAQQQRLGETKAIDSRSAALQAFMNKMDKTNF